jgi:hypothetical protein
VAAVVTKYGFVATAQRMIGTGAAAFQYMMLGTGSQTENTDASTLVAEITDSGLDRAVGDTHDAAGSSATASDTCRFVKTWTATGASNVKECGVGNSDTKDKGDLLCYGTFASAIPMQSDDTLKVTWSVQVKAG